MYISPNELQQVKRLYEIDGYIKISKMLSSESLEELKNEVDQIVLHLNNLPQSSIWHGSTKSGDDIVQRITRMNEHSLLIHKLANDTPWLLDILTQLLEVDKVKFADGTMGDYGSILIIKNSENLSSWQDLGWHQDTQFTSHLAIHPFINVGIYLDDADQNSGQLVVLPGSHLTVKSFDSSLSNSVEHHEGEIGIIANAGDIVLHSSEIWHCSRQFNATVHGQRRILYFKFYPDRSVF